MIGVLFEFAGEIIEVRVDNNSVLFRTKGTHDGFTTIEGIHLDKRGVIKEHPDLAENPEWKKETIKRFKEKIKSYNNEKEKMDYIINDLKKFGYVAVYYQRQGHRPIKIKQ